MPQKYLDHVFHGGLKVDTFAGPVTLEVRELGSLVVPSGWIVAGDPGVVPLPVPFAHRVPPGRYPVYVTVATRHRDNDCRVAFGILKLGEEAPSEWQVAALRGKELVPQQHPEEHGYGVDSGTGSFMDLEAARIVDGNGEQTFALLSEIMEDSDVPTWSWANLVLDSKGGLNLLAFTSGDGDGRYPSFWGIGGSGDRVALVTDFYVLLEPGQRP